MAEMEVHVKVFPFTCENPDCKKEYDLEGFAHVVELWGFIYLTNQKYSLIGIVCPDCKYTSLKKSLFYDPNVLTKTIIKTGIVNDLDLFATFGPINLNSLFSRSGLTHRKKWLPNWAFLDSIDVEYPPGIPDDSNPYRVPKVRRKGLLPKVLRKNKIDQKFYGIPMGFIPTRTDRMPTPPSSS